MSHLFAVEEAVAHFGLRMAVALRGLQDALRTLQDSLRQDFARYLQQRTAEPPVRCFAIT